MIKNISKISFFLGLSSLLQFSCLHAQEHPIADPYVLDVAQVEHKEPKAWLQTGPTTAPNGDQLGVNALYWTHNGKPWIPVMGEFHFLRYPANLWEIELMKMKAAGISIVSTYLFWEFSEEPQGSWDWTGNNNIRRFIELCKKHKLYVWLRPGPYINGEARNKGLPSWTNKKGQRSNAPWYLDLVQTYFNQVGEQTKGLYFKDGGPIIGCQLENEYAYGSKDHLAALKNMALKAGIHPCFFSATCNSEYHYNRGDILPLTAAYPYRYWMTPGPTTDYLYMDDEWGAMENHGKLCYDPTQFPRGLCELGGGCLNNYTHRFQVPAWGMEGLVQNVVARGNNLLGYYMYHGGTHKAGWEGPGLPQHFDYQAQLGEFGQTRPSYHALRLWHMFLNDFGELLAPMQPVRPENMIRDPRDVSRVRFAGRFNQDRGFLFLNNCQPYVDTHPIDKVQFAIKLSEETLKVPSSPITIPANASPTFPINIELNGIPLRFSTARLIAQIDDTSMPCYVFCEEKGIRPEFQFSKEVQVQTSAECQVIGQAMSYFPKPSRNIAMTLANAQGKKAHVLLLSRQDAERAWRFDLPQHSVLMISDANLISHGNNLTLSSYSPRMELAVYPSSSPSLLGVSAKHSGIFSTYTFNVPTFTVSLQSSTLPQKSWALNIPDNFQLPDHVRDIFYQVTYTGSTADLMKNNERYTDHRHIGLPFEFSISRFLHQGAQTLTVIAKPWDDNVKGIPDTFKPVSTQERQGMIRTVHPRPEYQLTIPKL